MSGRFSRSLSANARGYYRHEYMAHTFNPDVSFEVDHREAPAAAEREPQAQPSRQIGANTCDESDVDT